MGFNKFDVDDFVKTLNKIDRDNISENELRNSNLEANYLRSRQNHYFRKHIKNTLLGLLVGEVVFIGLLICAQGFKWWSFDLTLGS